MKFLNAIPFFKSAVILLSILVVLPAQGHHSGFDHVQSSQDELLTTQGMASSSADTLWDLGAAGSGIRILSIDTGVLSTHEELNGRITCRADLHTTSDCSDGQTGSGHGTAIATIMGASSMNGVGITSVAPLVDGIDSIKFQLDNSSGSPIKHRIGLDLVNVLSNPTWWNSSAVITMSTNEDYTITPQDTTNKNNICNAINGFLSAGKIVVLASGNDSKEIVPRVGLGTPTNYPSYCEVSHPNATHDNKLLVVGGTTVAPFNTRWTSSSYGAVVDLYAPAESVYSAAKTGNTAYANFTGTSFAAPMVAGAAAQLLSCGVAADNVKQYLQDGSSVTITQPAGGNKKRLDVKGALQWAHQHVGSSTTVTPYLLNAFEAGTSTALPSDTKIITSTDTVSGIVIADMFTDTQLTSASSTANRARCNRFAYTSSSPDFSIDASGVLRFTGTADTSTTITSTDFFGVTTSKLFFVDVNIAVNNAPTASDNTLPVNEDSVLTFTTAHFNYSDVDNDPIAGVRIVSLPSIGNLSLNNTVVAAGQLIGSAAIAANQLTFTPVLNTNGSPYTSFTFRVNDGATDSVTANTMTVNVAAINDPPAGVPTISGTAEEGATLSAVTTAITDADGLGTFSYQWLRASANISGATGSNYVPVDADVGTQLSVRVSYTDAQGAAESVTSAVTIAIVNVNDPPVGVPTISGTTEEGATLTANTASITDADGLGTFSYQWLRANANISGATGSNYVPVDADVGTQLSVRVSYTDAQGTAESVTSAATIAIVNVNDPPVGVPTISGTAEEGATLSAVTTAITDADGLGAFSYQWLRANANISGATGTSYVPVDADVGTQLSVRVSYTDAQGTAESVTSAATIAIVNVNDPPVGVPTISGTAEEGATLTANTASITDADGLGTFSYQWLRASAAISGATGTSYVPVDADVGTQLSVRVSYLDGQGTAESVTSATVTVILNDPDGDGITAYLDNCPNHSNTNQLDSDSDARGDVCDPDDENDLIIDSPIQFNISQGSGIGETFGTQVFQNLGTVTIKAVLNDLDAEGSFIYDWSATDSDIFDIAVINGDELTFNPTSLTIPVSSNALVHTIALTTKEGNSRIYNTILVTLKASSSSPPMIFDCNNDQVIDVNDPVDCDQDGVLNPADGFSDTDYDGIANYLDDNGLSAHQTAINLGTPSVINITNTQNDLSINLGPIARYAGRQSIAVDTTNIADVGGTRGTPVSNEIDASHPTVSEPLRDIRIDGFARVGADGRIVIALQSGLSANAVYRQYQSISGWQNFTIDGHNRLASATGSAGLCPAPGNPAYSDGLTASDNCIQLTIRDGGPNDADDEVNGEIHNLGTIAESNTAPPPTPNETGGGSGSAFGMLEILLLLFGLGCKFFLVPKMNCLLKKF